MNSQPKNPGLRALRVFATCGALGALSVFFPVRAQVAVPPLSAKELAQQKAEVADREAKREREKRVEAERRVEEERGRRERESAEQDKALKRQQEENRRLKAELEDAQRKAVAPAQPGAAASSAAGVQGVAAGSQPRQREAYEPQMVVIPGGKFTMGSGEGEGQADERPSRPVNIRAFELGKFEVTQGQWKAVMGSNPSRFSHCGDDCPVENVSWNDIQQYVQKLNQKTGQQYRLPSEGEWEYAARAGCKTEFSVGEHCKDKLEVSEANFDGNYSYKGSAKGPYREKTVKVGSFAANRYGVHDMHGNVWERVQDCYESDYSKGQPTDGRAHRGADSGCGERVLRGGSWYGSPVNLRSAFRFRVTPGVRNYGHGFRLARTVP